MQKLYNSVILSLFLISFGFAQMSHQSAIYRDPAAKSDRGKLIFNYNADKLQKVNAKSAVTYKIKFSTDEAIDMVIFNSTGVVDLSGGYWTDDHHTFNIDINEGTYDMIFGSFNHLNWYIKENVNITTPDSMSINWATDVPNTIELRGKDENGNPFTNYTMDWEFTSIVIFPPAGSPFTLVSVFNICDGTTFHFNTFSDRFTAFFDEFKTDILGQCKLWVVQHPLLHGISSSQTLINDPSEYKSQVVKLNNITTDYCFVTFSHDYMEKNEGVFPGGVNMNWMKMDSLITSWQIGVYVTPDRTDKVSFTSREGWFESNGLYPMSPGYIGQDLYVNNDNSVSSYFTNTATPDLYKAPSGTIMNLGTGPVCPYQLGFNNYSGTSNIGSSPRFIGALKEYRITDNNRATYSIINSSNTEIANGELGSFAPMDVPAGPYTFIIKNNTYKVQGAPGMATITENFDLTRSDCTPARITSYRLENSNGIYTDALQRSETGKVVFAAGDYYVNPDPDHLGYSPIVNDSTLVWYKLSTSNTWIPLTAVKVNEEERVGFIYNVTIPSSLTNINEGNIDFKFQVVDQAGNKTELEFKPAFAVLAGTPVELTNLTASQDNNFIVLNWSTATEKNNKGFDVEKLDARGNWNKIGFVPGFGTSIEKHNYTYKEKLTNAQSVLKYRLKQVDFDGSYTYSKVVEFKTNVPVSFSLQQNYPNPFNPSTIISYSLPVESSVKIRIYNMLGEETALLLNEVRPAGNHQLQFNAANLSSGVYLYSIEAAGKDNSFFRSVKKMTLIK